MQSGCPIRIRHLDDVIENDDAELVRQDRERPFRYGHCSQEDYNVASAILGGGADLQNLPSLPPNVVRMFVCSSGPDFEAERNYLLENVYPQVRDHCRHQYGVDFQLIDMYWGDPNQPSRDPHHMLPVHKELSYCQQISMGPNFVAFVGQKYGDVNPPLEIPALDMDAIKVALVSDQASVALLDKWYTLDINVSPNVYRLQRCSCVETEQEFVQMVTALQSVVSKCLPSEVASTYFQSDFERLLQTGLLSITDENPDKKCLVYVRDIQNIDQHLGAKNAGNFVDIDTDTGVWSTAKKERIDTLKKKIDESVSDNNILKTTIELNGCTLDEKKSGEYVTNIGRHFFSTVTDIVEKEMAKRREVCEDWLIKEVVRHWERVANSSSQFVGRDDVMNSIKCYLLSETDQPFVLIGEVGSGMTSIVAKAANDINEAVANGNLSMPTTVIPRFVGETENSEDIQPFLLHLCHQLAYVTGRYRQDIPKDYPSLKNYFIDLLQRGEYGGMIVLLIDSLDTLSSIDDGHKLDWLPPRIAANIKLVITVDAANEDMVRRLENKIDAGLITLPEFCVTDCENAMKLLMSLKKKSVNYNQWKRIQMAFKACPSPLFVKLAFSEALKWHSYDNLAENIIQNSAYQFVDFVFEKLENKHGKFLVTRLLGYLTASKNGLSESELDDVASLDDELLNCISMQANEYQSIRRFPSQIWTRVRQDIEPLLEHKKIDDIAVLTWKDILVREVAEARYCPPDAEETIKVFSNLSDYFLGTWSGTRRKPFLHPSVLMAKYKLVEKEDESCRHVPEQPLIFGDFKHFNKRKMSQLPYILSHSERLEDMKSAIFCNYEWLENKLKAFSLQHVLADFSLCDDREVLLVGDALRMSKSALTINPGAVGTELTGRLLPHIKKYPYIRNLIRQCDLNVQRNCPLVPNCQIYSAPGGPLQYECDVGGDKNCPINIDVFSSPDGILLTAKPYYSSRLQVWELTRGDERPDIMLPVGDVKPTRDGRYINIIVGDKCIKSYKSDCGVLHGQVSFESSGKIADIDVSNRFIAIASDKGAGPRVIDIERSELIHKFTYHTHAVAISCEETYLAFNSENSILLFELPVMKRKCVAKATDVAHDIMFINELPKCYVLTKTKLVEAIAFDVINGKYRCKTVFTDLDARECVLSNSKSQMIVRCGKSLNVLDTILDKVNTRIQKLPAGVFLDTNSTFTGAGFSPDDKMIVAARYTYLIIWDAETYAPIRVLQSMVSPVKKLFMSDSVNNVVSLLEDNSFQVWNLDNLDRETHHAIEIHHSRVQSVAASSNTGIILTHDDKTPDAKLVSLSTGRVLDTLQHSEESGDELLQVSLSPDGAYAVTRARVAVRPNAPTDIAYSGCTDDVMWEVETAAKVFHATASRYVVFSPDSNIAAFVTSACYNRLDWTDNIYNVFIVEPETSSNYTIDFPYNTEFVCPPCIVQKDDSTFFVAVTLSCRKVFDKSTQKETTRRSEVRLFTARIESNESKDDPEVLPLHNIAEDVNGQDQFLAAMPCADGNLLVIYCRDVESYTYEVDKGVVPPKSVSKGAVIYDLASKTSLRQFPDFLHTSSRIDSLLFSRDFEFVMDSDLRLFSLQNNKSLGPIQSCKFADGTAKLALNGRYIVGLSDNRQQIVIVRTADDKKIGNMFVHGKAACLDIAEDDRTVVVGCDDGRVMILSLILELPDPLREFIEELPSRKCESDDDRLLARDIRHISNSTSEQHRLSARIRRESVSEERRPPSYTILHRAVSVSRQSSRHRGSNACMQQ